MFRLCKILSFALAIVVVFGRDTNDRQARLFRYAQSVTDVKDHWITSIVPSSCVQYDATLPPCRNVEFLYELPQIAYKPREKKANNLIDIMTRNNVLEPSIISTPLGWGEYLGFVAPTVTVLTTTIKVTTVEDPSTVVTYSIGGCKPNRLPLNLNHCSPPEMAEMAIVPTSTIGANVHPTAITDNLLHDNANTPILEGAENDHDVAPNGAVSPTETL